MRVLTILSGILVSFALVLGTAVWLLLQPGFAVEQVQRLVAERSGHRLTVGASHVALLPAPAIVLEDVEVSEPGTTASPLLKAKEMTLNASLGGMLMRELAVDTVEMEGAHVNVTIDAGGMPNWQIRDDGSAGLPDLTLRGSTLALVDQRSGLALRVEGFSGTVAIAEDGAVAVEGNFVSSGRIGTLGVSLVSLGRLQQDGSPVSLSLSDGGMKFSFDGRLALKRSLDLAGQATLEWPERVAVSGPFEASGRTISFRQARLETATGNGSGDASIDFSAHPPKLTGAFAFDSLDLAALAPRLAFDGSWSERSLGLGRLKQLAIAAEVDIGDLCFGKLSLGRARMSVDAADGRLQVSMPDTPLYGGTANASLSIDGGRDLPEMALSIAAEKLSLPKGHGTIPSLSLTLTSQGASQAELIGRLNGSARFVIAKGGPNLPNLHTVIDAAGKSVVSQWPTSEARSPSFDEFNASFSIADGIATTADLRVAAPGIRLSGGGEIDLLRRAVDLKADALGANGKPAFPVPLILQGPWNAPRLYPDMPGILEDPEAAYKALNKLKLAAEVRK